MTRNITLAIDDALLDKVRVLAAMKRTTVNEAVRGFLTQWVQQETSKDEARTRRVDAVVLPAQVGRSRCRGRRPCDGYSRRGSRGFSRQCGR